MKFNFVFITEAFLTFALIPVLLLLLGSPSPISASDNTTPNPEMPTSSPASAPIQDNSFLIEEAYNQEDGVVQHISSVQRSFGSGALIFTQTDEWPVRSLRHQLSLTMSAVNAGEGLGLGDTAINYRYQLTGSGDARVAVAPRLSLLLPSGNFRSSRGNGGIGLQTNLPLSWQLRPRLVTHWNAGFTWIPRAREASGDEAVATNLNLGQSFVWLTSARFNGLLETLWTSTSNVIGAGATRRRQDLYVSPGIRWAHNLPGGLQIVPGIGVPLGVGPSAGDVGLILYLSFEHPWAIAHSRRGQ